MERFRILQLSVDSVHMDSAVEFVNGCVRYGSRPEYIVCANPEKVYAVASNEWLRRFFDAAGLVLPDGIGIVLAARVLHGRRLGRVPGADLMQTICATAADRGYRIFLYGSSPDTNAKAADALRKRYRGIQIVGREHGYVPAAEVDGLVDRINASHADILFVGLGSPRQEIWIQRHLPRLKVKLVQGIGGTLDTIAGNVKRAPKWMQAAGLEWFYRLLKQPTRAQRQLKLIRFAADVLRAKLAGGAV
jgi:N-acetylglucosaminyldiphosphoundecaprenol N-acetyl-beta-D-mannosaminyltransferase